MSGYTLDGTSATLTTAAPDGTYSHPSGERGTWNGFAVPNATFAELLEFSDAACAEGARWVFRPVLIDGEMLVLFFPCDGDCHAMSSGDFWPLGDGEHAHHDDAYEWMVHGEHDPEYVDGLMWDCVEP
ncbi:MAG: hypothetical protein NVV57_10730 [Demequina sp.]|nr:hypothetical protein [Demequina sp.]